jgi:hypothetical protein
VDTYLVVAVASQSNKELGCLMALIAGQTKNKWEHSHINTRLKSSWKARDKELNRIGLLLAMTKGIQSGRVVVTLTSKTTYVNMRQTTPMIAKAVKTVALIGKNHLSLIVKRLTVGVDLHLRSLLHRQHGQLLIILQLQLQFQDGIQPLAYLVIMGSVPLLQPLSW